MIRSKLHLIIPCFGPDSIVFVDQQLCLVVDLLHEPVQGFGLQLIEIVFDLTHEFLIHEESFAFGGAPFNVVCEHRIRQQRVLERREEIPDGAVFSELEQDLYHLVTQSVLVLYDQTEQGFKEAVFWDRIHVFQCANQLGDEFLRVTEVEFRP